MNEGRVDLQILNRMIRDGKRTKQIAQFFEVTPSAISKAKKLLKHNIIRNVGLEKANEVVESHLDMMAQLRRVNETINAELDRAKEDVEKEGCDKRSIQEIIIKLSAEIRKQCDLYLNIAQVWHDMKVYGEFQEEILGILDEVQPGIRNEIIKRLKERRVLRGAVSLT